MIFIPLALLLLLLLYGPQLWARWILSRHSKPRTDYPGSGGEFARHLLNKLDLGHVTVEGTEQGDHYDPSAKAVRLSPDNLNGRSLTAVAVAAHEVGHALQDKINYGPLVWRGRLVLLAQRAEKLGSILMILMPFVGVISRSPLLGGAFLVAALLSMGVIVIVHLITLPVELDASFGRAMPLLKAGQYLDKKDERAARRILQACALTYLAASLAGLLNFWRWFSLLRR